MNREYQPQPQSTDVTASSTDSQHASPNAPPRPLLQRLPRSNAVPRTSPVDDPRSPGPRPEDDDAATTGTDTDMSEDGNEHGNDGAGGRARSGIAPSGNASPDEIEIERLRSLQLKILQQQQRARMRNVSANTGTQGPGARRVSPIKEEPISAISPTLEGAFASASSPLLTGVTASTESTESAKTIRGSVPPTPAGHAALRTPSYPFPTVPNTPRWASSFHMPFTNLSPTVSAVHPREWAVPKDRIASESSTPAASTTPFMPGERPTFFSEIEDPRYPSPNLYELVLQLGAEPGLAAWWAAVTTIMKDHYGAERATLAVPADASDIENVPWGQKATYTVPLGDDNPPAAKCQEPFATKQSIRVQQPTPRPEERPPPTSNPERRPRLFSHHSFAGHERHKAEATPLESPPPSTPARPRGPLRAASHATQAPAREHPLRQVSRASFDGPSSPFPSFMSTSAHDPSFSDPDFSSVGGEPTLPAAVFSVLRALDHEPDALIDNTGVNRVLERGRLVTLTRDYSTSMTNLRKDNMEKEKPEDSKFSAAQAGTAGAEPQKAGYNHGKFTTKSSNLGPGSLGLRPSYEEYEQYPTSPWAQSPAPSPAIQNDVDANPFFTTSNVDEDTFNPSRSPQDYTQYGVVEAIGVDRASTVTHIPLIHPTLSQTMHTVDTSTPAQTPNLSRRQSEQLSQASTSQREGFIRKAPIAILSILSPVVPYPRNLTNSLKHLGPHLATSFSNAWQFTNAQIQVNSIRQRRAAGQGPGGTNVSDAENLNDLLHIDLGDLSNSAAGSVTSPSDYSGRSKYSPGDSITGTPGWDAASMGFSSKHSISSTPGQLAGSEAVESYFDTKRRTKRASSQPKASEKKIDKRASVNPVMGYYEDDAPTPKNEKGTKDELSNTKKKMQHHRGHTLLHSYGADFGSSFQSLPAATGSGGCTPAPSGHGRRSSITETFEMPPPSESLLRTIIDSLPVQIFTAAPITGAITWVNSKFLIYGGQDTRQVLQDPWESIHPDDRESYLEQWNKSLRTGQQLQKKVRLQRFDKCYRWFYVRVAPLKNKRQQIVHWIGTNMDFHEQHLAELNSAKQQETAASEAKYRALANSSPQIVFVVSNRRGLTFCNSQWTTFSGQAEKEALASGFLEYVHPDDVIKCKLPDIGEDGSANVPTTVPSEHSRHNSQNSSSSDDSSETDKTITSPGSTPEKMDMPQAKLSKLASTGILKVAKDADGRAFYSTEVRLRNKDGEYRWHLVRILLEKSLAVDSADESWYGTATDINDHKLLEQTLKETMDAKTRFLSNMSHEIRTPLNGISGMVNFLQDSPLNTEQLEHVNIINASTASLLNLINDILDLSKVEAGMIKLSMEWMHLPSLLEEVNDLNMGLAIQKGLELNYLMEEGVPSMVKGDKFRIRQVLLNVVGNAIKFTPEGEIFVRCKLQPPDRSKPLNENETMVRFEVVDTGRGFTESEAKYLFKRFSQIDASSTRQHGGTGLGLAISMQFVELHGGKMDARSVPGKGSTFFFTIKFGLPTPTDFPQPLVSTPLTPATELLTMVPSLPSAQPSPLQRLTLPHIGSAAQNAQLKRVSSISSEQSVKSPVTSSTASIKSQNSPSLSSGSSDHSLTNAALTGKSSLRSERSSASSFLAESRVTSPDPEINLSLPPKRAGKQETASTDSLASDVTARPATAPPYLTPPIAQPPMYSILVVCPLVHSREATIRHIKNTLPQGIPHQITGEESLLDAQRMLGGESPIIFTHVVLVLHDTAQVHAVMDQIFSSVHYGNTSVVVVSDPSQKKELMKEASVYDYEQLNKDRRLQFIYRPLKPSKFAVIFDPEKQRESSTDRNQDTAQQVVVSQKLVFEELQRRLGGKGHKVLLVEDNQINQTVSISAPLPPFRNSILLLTSV